MIHSRLLGGVGDDGCTKSYILLSSMLPIFWLYQYLYILDSQYSGCTIFQTPNILPASIPVYSRLPLFWLHRYLYTLDSQYSGCTNICIFQTPNILAAPIHYSRFLIRSQQRLRNPKLDGVRQAPKRFAL